MISHKNFGQKSKFGSKLWVKNLGLKFGSKIWVKNLGQKFGSKVWVKNLNLGQKYKYGLKIDIWVKN